MSIYCLKIKFINKRELQSICYIKGAKFERIENRYIMLPSKSVPFSPYHWHSLIYTPATSPLKSFETFLSSIHHLK